MRCSAGFAPDRVGPGRSSMCSMYSVNCGEQHSSGRNAWRGQSARVSRSIPWGGFATPAARYLGSVDSPILARRVAIAYSYLPEQGGYRPYGCGWSGEIAGSRKSRLRRFASRCLNVKRSQAHPYKRQLTLRPSPFYSHLPQFRSRASAQRLISQLAVVTKIQRFRKGTCREASRL